MIRNIEDLKQSCRVCLQKGDINIWNHKVKLTEEEYIDTIELINVFNDTLAILELGTLLPLLCWQCLEEFKTCYKFYDKIKKASYHLRNFYDECHDHQKQENQLLEEDTTDETNEENDIIVQYYNDVNQEAQNERTNNLDSDDILQHSPKLSINPNSSYVVTQFFPAKLHTIETSSYTNPEEVNQQRNLLTIDCKAVEIKDVTELHNLESPTIFDFKETLSTQSPSTSADVSIYMCQYCPHSFAKLEFLKTHILKCHICKFCTQPFNLATELYRHLKEEHTEHRCAICQKTFSSNTNLRHHIRRVHRINLPPKMTLLDFVPTNEEEEVFRGVNNLVNIEEDLVEQQLDENSIIISPENLNICN
ncbi:uncharacterized protein isoform X2 [Musca autumnalis]|uniref:uncharacterized protein isoform X2 n=1 Tax=Musca autumnalis TaxID=221902 RepID=UPI003CF3082F